MSADYRYHDKPEMAMGNPQLLNLYAYALNNPTKYTDPTGMSPDNATSTPDEDAATEKVVQSGFNGAGKALEDTNFGKGMGLVGNILSGGSNLGTLLDPKASSMDKLEAGHGLAGAAFGIGEAAATAAGATETAAAFSAGGLITTVATPLLIWAKGMHEAREGALRNNRKTGRRSFATGEAAALWGLSLQETKDRFGFTGTAPNRNAYETMKAANAALEKGWRKTAQYSDTTKTMILENLTQKAAQSGKNYFYAWNGSARDVEPLVTGFANIIRENYGAAVHAGPR